MILVDAVYINEGGGKVLFDYLVEQIERQNLNVFYLLDKRIENKHPHIQNTGQVKYIKGSLKLRNQFYREHKNDFSNVLCFGNIPPTIRLDAKVYTYFHQYQYLKIPKELSLVQKMLFGLKILVLKRLVSNTDFWMVQSTKVKDGLTKRFNRVTEKQVKILPFYPPLVGNANVTRKKNSFVYVSSGVQYKNHIRLIKAFFMFYDEHKKGELHLTVGENYSEIITLIKHGQDKGYPIFNYGFVSRGELLRICQSAEFAIYPSLTESFGLGIIEAIENGCKIIGADLPYMYAVCEPSFIFDPLSAESMAEVMGQAILQESKLSKQLVFNEINDLLTCLK